MQGPQDQLDVNQLVLQIVLNLFVVAAAQLIPLHILLAWYLANNKLDGSGIPELTVGIPGNR
jgi:hypothetical protein